MRALIETNGRIQGTKIAYMSSLLVVLLCALWAVAHRDAALVQSIAVLAGALITPTGAVYAGRQHTEARKDKW